MLSRTIIGYAAAIACLVSFHSMEAQSHIAKYTYNQKTGDFKGSDTNGDKIDAKGYSGTNSSGAWAGYNNPYNETVPDVGPIPVGKYLADSVKGSPSSNTIVLSPTAETDTKGRNGFLIHGDNKYHDASKGCIVLDAEIRKTLANQVASGHSVTIEVISGQ